jgi:uncharacterized protein YecT (DUF1311 family)
MAKHSTTRRLAKWLLPLSLGGCVIHHVLPYNPQTAPAPETADAASASTNCFEASTTVEKLACADPGLAAANRGLTETFQAQIRSADMFGRDVLLAAQRAWFLGLPAACQIPADGAPPANAAACLIEKYHAQAASLTTYRQPARQIPAAHALAQYVKFRPAAGGAGLNTAFCTDLARDINAALSRTGSADPGAIPGGTEIAGSHGPASAGQYSVDLRFANAFGSFAQRARSVSIGNEAVLDSLSLGRLLQTSAENNGARFSAYASQTGDYGAADVVSRNGQTLALLADTWGFNTPAAPGEFAHAGVWDLAPRPAQPLCLFETFQMAAEPGEFDQLAAFAPFRDLLSQIRDSVQPALGVGFLRDQGQLRAETNWTLLHMPLLATEQARSANWTNWLRIRHDAVLDALFAWSTAAANKPVFDKLFALLRPAAQDLARAYQQTQALTGAEAREAAGVAVMELLYGATVNIAPDLGTDLRAPESALGQKPRYPILASPS